MATTEGWTNLLDVPGVTYEIAYKYHTGEGPSEDWGPRVLEVVGGKFVLPAYIPPEPPAPEYAGDAWYGFTIHASGPGIQSPLTIRLTGSGTAPMGSPTGAIYVGQASFDADAKAIGPYHWSDIQLDSYWESQVEGVVEDVPGGLVEFYPDYPQYGAINMEFEFTIEVNEVPPFWTRFKQAFEDL